MSVLPAVVTLNVEPTALRRAVAALEDGPVGSPPVTADQIRALIDTLKRTTDFAALRLTSRELRALRDLGADRARVDADRDLLERFVRAAESNATRMTDDVIAGIIASRLPDPRLHRALAAAIAHREVLRGPRWYRDHAFLYQDAATFVPRLGAALKKATPLNEIAAASELSRGSPLYTDLIVALIDRSTPAERIQSRSAWYQFATSAFDPVELRLRAFSLLFQDLQRASPRPDFHPDGEATRWVKTAQTVCGGWPREKAAVWALLPVEARRWAEVYLTLQAIERFFDRTSGNLDRREYWRTRATQITDFREFSTARAFMMKLGNRYLVEFLETGNACYSYTEHEWSQLTTRKHQSSSTLKLDHVRGTEHWLKHALNWQNHFDDYLERYARVPRPR